MNRIERSHPDSPATEELRTGDTDSAAQAFADYLFAPSPGQSRTTVRWWTDGFEMLRVDVDLDSPRDALIEQVHNAFVVLGVSTAALNRILSAFN